MRNKLALTLLLCCLPLAANAAQVKEVTTPSGIKAWLVEEHTLPIISAKVVFRDAGYAYDPAGKEGRANMASDMLDQGSGKMDALAFSKALEERAIGLSFGVDEDMFAASLKTTSENKTQAFALMGQALLEPTMAEADLTRIRARTMTQLTQMEQSPDWRLGRAWAAAAYGSHGYGNASIGNKESIAKLTRADLSDYLKRYLTKDNLIISVAGDITEKELSDLLESALHNLPASYSPDVTLSDVVIPSAKTPVVIQQDMPQTIVSFGMQGLKREDPRYFDAYVMNYLLGGSGSLTSRLGVEIREKRGLAYYAQTSLDPSLHGATLAGIFATRNDQVEQAVTTMRDTLRKFASDGVSDAELEDAKRYITGSFVLSLDTNAELTNFMTTMQLHHLGMDYLEKRNSLVNAVTKANVNAMAKELIHADDVIVVMIGNPKAEHASDPETK